MPLQRIGMRSRGKTNSSTAPDPVPDKVGAGGTCSASTSPSGWGGVGVGGGTIPTGVGTSCIEPLEARGKRRAQNAVPLQRIVIRGRGVRRGEGRRDRGAQILLAKESPLGKRTGELCTRRREISHIRRPTSCRSKRQEKVGLLRSK